MSSKELRAMSDKELVHHELQTERDLAVASLKLRGSTLENTASVRQMRRAVARARTIQREREREQGLAKDHLLHLHRQDFKPGEGGGEQAEGGFLSGVSERFGLEG